MNLAWVGPAISIASRVLPLVISTVHAVEALAGAKKGKEKQDAAVEALQAGLSAIEGIYGRDVFNDAEGERILRDLVDAVVAAQNFINAKVAVSA